MTKEHPESLGCLPVLGSGKRRLEMKGIETAHRLNVERQNPRQHDPISTFLPVITQLDPVPLAPLREMFYDASESSAAPYR